MPFTKDIKTSAYHSRFQTPYRRRREGKTDYYARKRLIAQHKAKYGTPKYRLVVRITNKDIITQIVSSQINGDIVMSAAYSHELPRYGISHGLTNWAAGYATGLLIARRVLAKLNLDDKYIGTEEADGEYTITEALEEGPRPFKVFLDVGLARTTTGARIFGVLKGASDGGLHIPHSEKRYPGYDIETKDLDAETLRKYIVGGHVAEYMEELQDDDEERFRELFKGYIDDDLDADSLEDLYLEAHKKIREDPSPKKSESAKSKEHYAEISKKFKTRKLTLEQKKKNREEKAARLLAQVEQEKEEQE